MRKLSTAKTITIIVFVMITAVAFYFASYYLCGFLLKRGFISATGRCQSPPISDIIGTDITSEPPAVATSSPAASTAVQPDPLPNISDPTLVFGSYFDTFANYQFLDKDKTTLYYDENAAAIFFKPDYLFEEADAAEIAASDRGALDAISLNSFQGSYSDRRCLDNKCLSQAGKDLFFDSKQLALPSELSGLDIVNISIGSLTKRWLVGVTIKNKSDYTGMIYSFDGRGFARILTPAPIRSPYSGVFGFGGGENNFLAVYGAYQGIAYHFQGDKISDVSRFFDIRVMSGGFKPEILFTAFEKNVNWYIYSSTSYHPVLIKLWQNGGTEIAGETVFRDLFDRRDESAVFKLSRAENSAIILLSKVKRGAGESWHYFHDRGFKNESSGLLMSVPIAHDGDISVIEIAKIAQSRLGIDAASADKAAFYFSVDGLDWRKLGNETNVDIEVPATRYFFLKAIFPSFKDRFYSPFISDMIFDYYCRK